MATVIQVLNWALQDAGVLGEGETASAAMASDALATLNQMLALWQVENVYVYAQRETSFTPTGATSYTVGTGANVNMARPARIDAAFWRSNALDYPITLLDTFEQYEAIPQKTQAGEPLYAFYLPSYVTGTLYLHPQPSSGTVHLITQAALPSEVAAADTLLLPPQYVLPIRLNLGVMLRSMFGSPLQPMQVRMADSSLRVLKRANLRIQPLVQPTQVARPNIFAG